MGRGEQRKKYDQRRRDVLPKNGIALIEFNYDEFDHFSGKRLEAGIRGQADNPKKAHTIY